MKITFNKASKITKRHMAVLGEFIPVQEYGFPSKYFTCSAEHDTRKAACVAMLKQLHILADAGILPAIENLDILSSVCSRGDRNLFVEV